MIDEQFYNEFTNKLKAFHRLVAAHMNLNLKAEDTRDSVMDAYEQLGRYLKQAFGEETEDQKPDDGRTDRKPWKSTADYSSKSENASSSSWDSIRPAAHRANISVGDGQKAESTGSSWDSITPIYAETLKFETDEPNDESDKNRVKSENTSSWAGIRSVHHRSVEVG